ncbi:hypothetical protein BH09MYX1_BH09MYX1_60860 [soil metagenome]
MKKPDDFHRIRKAFQIAVGVLASRTFGGCGACPPYSEHDEIYTPPGNGPEAGADGALPTLDQATCDRLCGEPTLSCTYASADASGAVVIRCTANQSCGAGLRPAGFVARRHVAEDDVAGWLFEMAELEAASVLSFRTLERELDELGAPTSLQRRARAAAADEVRHARTMRRIALRRDGAGGTRRDSASGTRRDSAITSPRSVLGIAIENAVEGCVRETFAALVCAVAASRATDGALGDALAVISRDETRHASLAHAVHRFFLEELDVAERAALQRAYDAALARLDDDAPIYLATKARTVIGMPTPEELRALARSLASSLARSSEETLAA